MTDDLDLRCATCVGTGRVEHRDMPDGSRRATTCLACDGSGRAARLAVTDDLDPAAVERAARAGALAVRGVTAKVNDRDRTFARAALAAARDGEADECAHPGGGDVDESGRCAWHRPAAPTVTAEQVAEALCEPGHRDRWPLVGEDRYCGECIVKAERALRIEVREP